MVTIHDVLSSSAALLRDSYSLQQTDSCLELPTRAAIDVGGTFTDLCALDESTGKFTFTKDSTTPQNFAHGVLNVIRKSGLKGEQIDRFIGTGSTMVINSLTERKGSKVILVTTKGFRDVLEIQRSNRTDLYNLRYAKPQPYVPRRLRMEVDERTDYSGKELKPLSREDMMRVAKACDEQNAESVAIAFYNSYANPAHELEARDILKSNSKVGYITMSHELSREWREYERVNTAVLNAFVQPKVHEYLTTLEKELIKIGAKIQPHVMQSNGGVSSFDEGRRTPIYQVESGPIGGVIGAIVVAKEVGSENVISFDVGGTTAKTSLVDSGQMGMNTEYHIQRNQFSGGYPVKVPVVDIVEIGAGGGSIAWIDELGSLKVGPISAGADPGPASMGKGGTEPTITDAFVLTGVIDPHFFLGGQIELDASRAERAYAELAAKMKMKPLDVAMGAIEIATANMVNAIKLVSVRRGYDPRDFVMVAFGGGGPMFATEIAEQLGISQVVIPRVPGVFSAWGMLMTDLRHDFVRTRVMQLNEGSLGELQSITDEMKKLGTEELKREEIAPSDMSFEVYLDVRYAGQEHTVPTPAPLKFDMEGLAKVQQAFNRLHYRKFSFSLKDPMEVVNVRLTALGRVKKAKPRPEKTLKVVPAKRKSARLVTLAEGHTRELPIYDRRELKTAARIHGPAIIEEETSTTILGKGNEMKVDGYGNLLVKVTR